MAIALRNPQMVMFLLVLPLLYVTWRMRGKRLPRLVVGIRLVVTTLVILSLTDPILGQAPPPSTPLVILADQSDSLTESGKAMVRARSTLLATPPRRCRYRSTAATASCDLVVRGEYRRPG